MEVKRHPNDDRRGGLLHHARLVCDAGGKARARIEPRDPWLNPPDASEAGLKKRTLTNLYNARPTWLDNVHRRLDAAVFAAYGWPVVLNDEEILERLLALNLERVGEPA